MYGLENRYYQNKTQLRYNFGSVQVQVWDSKFDDPRPYIIFVIVVALFLFSLVLSGYMYRILITDQFIATLYAKSMRHANTINHFPQIN